MKSRKSDKAMTMTAAVTRNTGECLLDSPVYRNRIIANCLHSGMCVLVCACIYVCMHVCMCACVCVCACAC